MLHKQQVSLSAQVPAIFFEVRGGAVLYHQEKQTLADTLTQIKRELKALQDGSEGRIRLQYAISEEEKYLYIVGHIADEDDTAKYSLYRLQINVEMILFPLDWEVELSVVRMNDCFATNVPLLDI